MSRKRTKEEIEKDLAEKGLTELFEGLKTIMIFEPWKNKKVGAYLDGDSELENAPTLKKKLDESINKIHKGNKKK